MIIKLKGDILSEMFELGFSQSSIMDVRKYIICHPGCNLVAYIKNDKDSRNMVMKPAEHIAICDYLSNNKLKMITLWHMKH